MMLSRFLTFMILLCFYITVNAQNVGIGTTNPVNKLTVDGRVDITDSLGIGTSTPTARLDVLGKVKITDGTQGANKFLKSDTLGIASWDSITFFDLLSPNAEFSTCPSLLSTIPTHVNPYNLAISGNYLYVNNIESQDLQSIDISNPSMPIVIDSVGFGANGSGYGLSISGNFAYVPKFGTSTLCQIDISNPASLQINNQISTMPLPYSIATVGNYVYVGCYSNHLQVFHFNPNPVATGSIMLAGAPLAIEVSNNNAYLLLNNSTMQVVNVANPSTPTIVGSLNIIGSSSSLSISGHYAYVVTNSPSKLYVIDIINPSLPVIVGQCNIPADPYYIKVSGNNAYVVHLTGEELQIINISNPNNPVVVNSFGTTSHLTSLALAGDNIYVSLFNEQSIQIINNANCNENYSMAVNPITGQSSAHALSWQKIGNNINNLNSGNVGIGTNSPSNKLSVVGNSDFAGNVGIGTTSPTNKLSVVGNSNFTGNVGIGTSNPEVNLDIVSSGNSGTAGQIRINAPNLTSGNITSIVQGKNSNAANQAEWRFNFYSDNNINNSQSFGFNYIQPFVTFTAAQKVGIGTTAPSNTLTVSGTADFTGNVGIGTIYPSTKLHVIGGVRLATGNEGAGKVLTSDANGNASWSPLPSGISPGTALGNTPYWNGSSWSVNSSNIYNAGGNVGIGTNNPMAKLHLTGSMIIANGTQGAGKILTSDASGNATWATPTGIGSGSSAGNTPYWNGASWITNSSNIFNDGGNIGIGTNSPSAKLSVNGNVKIDDGTQGTGKVLTSDANGLASWATPPGIASGTSTGNTLYWNGTTWVSNSSNIFNNGGNVGIGLNNPSNKLSVKGTVDISQRLGIRATSPEGELHVKSVENTYVLDQQQQVTNATGGGTSQWQSFTAGVTGWIRKVDLKLGSPLLNGSVAPGVLNIYSGAGVGGTLLSSTDDVAFYNPFDWKSYDLATMAYVVAGNQYTIEFTTPIAQVGWVDSNSNNPYAGGTAGSLGNVFPGTDFLFKTYVSYESNALVVADGKLGIGTTTPQAILDIAGNVKITNGSQGMGKVLTSDANGLASWAVPSGLTSNGTSPGNTPYWNGTTWVTNSSNIYNNGGNVGIGTNTPHSQAKLHIKNGSLTIDDNTFRFFSNGNPKWDIAGGNGSYEISRSGTAIDFYISGSTGNVGLGTTSPGGKFELSVDQGRKPSTNTWTIPSDVRLKNIDGPYTKGLSEILLLNPITYHYKNVDHRQFDSLTLNTQSIGFSAQDVQQVFPEAVGQDGDGYLNLNIHAILIAQVNAIKELKKENDELKAKNSFTNDRLSSLEAKMEQLLQTTIQAALVKK